MSTLIRLTKTAHFSSVPKKFPVSLGTSVDAASTSSGVRVTGRATHSLSRLVGAARILVVTAFAALTFSTRAAAESMNTPAEMVPIKVTATFSQEWDDADG